ncbi:MAG: pentapeptide repeat-containing protein [Anaerolineae bacterium]
MNDQLPEIQEVEGRSFSGLDLHGQELGFREFYGCVFLKCSFLETTFRSCRFVDCEFRECNLSLCRVKDCSFSNTRFQDSQVMGVDWTEASWPKRGFLRTVDFRSCALNHSTFIGLSLRGIELTECAARGVDFTEADLSRADLPHTDFSQSRFLHTDLTEADLTGATNYSIAPTRNVLKKTRFSLPEAVSLLYGLDIILTD